MFNNILPETSYVEDMYSEYLKTINDYSNIMRSGIFFRYIHINKYASTYELGTQTTFDRYNSGIKYDIYDYTPGFFISQVVNDDMDNSDLVGQSFEGPLEVTVYTIEEPNIEDLIVFNRPPLNNDNAIFRVINIRASLSGMHSEPSTNWFDLSLEYAPVTDLSKLTYLNNYAYCLPFEKYILQSDFERMINENQKISQYLLEFQNTNFDTRTELYFINKDGVKYAPLIQNKFLYDFFANQKIYEDFFPKINRPYGIKKFNDYNYTIDLTHNIKLSESITPQKLNIPILNFDSTINIYNLCDLLTTWVWDKTRETYPQVHVPKSVVFPAITTNPAKFDNLKVDSKLGIQINVGSLPINYIDKDK